MVLVCIITLADPGAPLACAPPTGSNSFIFAYVFTEKCLRWKLLPPQQLSTPPPQREILDPPLNKLHQHGSLDLYFIIITANQLYTREFCSNTTKLPVYTVMLNIHDQTKLSVGIGGININGYGCSFVGCPSHVIALSMS